jgi:hypothetical protein
VKAEWESARNAVARLSEPERQVLLTVLLVTAIIDGRVSPSESALLQEAHDLCRAPFDRAAVRRMLKAFLHGQGIPGRQANAVNGTLAP